jgi:predicted permease
VTPRPFRLGQPTRDLDDEIAFHLAERERALVAAGQDPSAAHAQALQRFGDLSTVRSECLAIDRDRDRAQRWAGFLSNLRQDAIYAVRTLRRQPGFAFIVLLILTVGIGANTAIFTLIDALMLRPLPVAHPEQLVAFGDPRRTDGLSVGPAQTRTASYPLYVDLRDQSHAFSGLYANGRTNRLDVLVQRGDEVTHPHGRYVSGNFFTVLGVRAAAGRTFTGDEDRSPGSDPVVVMSYGYWQRVFAGDHAAIGRTISINGVPLTIIGVATPDFTGDVVGQTTDLWIPIMMQPVLMPQTTWLTDRGVSWLLLMGRLAPGVTLANARAELTTIAARSLLAHATAADHSWVERQLRETPVEVTSGALGFSRYRSQYAGALVTLMVAVSLVLLVVCANVANLLLSRAVARSREIGVRIAIGAGRLRLVQQLFTESMLLAMLGTAFGLIAAFFASKALLHLVGGVSLALHLDGRILGFAVALSFATALLFGVLPAFRATQFPVATALRTQGRGGGPRSLSLGRYLVVAQVALSMLLVVGAGMLARSTLRLTKADVGVARDKLAIVDVDAQRVGFSGARLIALERDIIARIQRVPGVDAVSASANGIFSGTESMTNVQVEGFTARADTDSLVTEDAVGPAYFHTVGAHLLRGRDFEARDNETSPKVVVVNASFANFFFPRGEAVGRLVVADSSSWEIIGVVGDIEERNVRSPPVRRLYRPSLQDTAPESYFRFEVRASGDPARLVIPLRQAVASANPSLAILSVDPLNDLIRDSISGDRLVATMVSFFGLLALVLAALGLYGVMAYTTVRRTAEFGLRMALGAAPGSVGRMVVREAILMTIAGMVVGLPAAVLSARLVRAELFHISLFDPPSIGLATLVLGLSAALAAFIPATRAMRVDPLKAIHTE